MNTTTVSCLEISGNSTTPICSSASRHLLLGDNCDFLDNHNLVTRPFRNSVMRENVDYLDTFLARVFGHLDNAELFTHPFSISLLRYNFDSLRRIVGDRVVPRSLTTKAVALKANF